jgi:hypothetical protein
MTSTASSDAEIANGADADDELQRCVPRRAKQDLESELDAPQITDEIIQAWIRHPVGTPRPDVPRVVVPDGTPSEIDEAIAVRLLASYNACKKEEAAHPAIGPDVWSAIRRLQAAFFTVLESGEPKTLAAFLCNMSRHDATIGISQGNEEYRWITSSPEYEHFRALLIKDRLVSFAEAVGAIRCECPEVGPWGRHMHADIDVLLQALEERVGTSLAPPEIDGGLFKLRAGTGLVHDRDLHGQFAAWSMREIAGPDAAICEIGGGVGRAAYWAQRFGLGPYTIIDLPHVNVLQGYYLLKSLPMDQVCLYCETLADPRVTVLPYFEKRLIDSDEVDMVFNQDSLPEIHRDAALDYLAWTRKIARSWFYSINQEAGEAYSQRFWEPAGEGDPRQNVVSELATEARGFRRILRAPYWLRRGYTAELYQILP